VSARRDPGEVADAPRRPCRRCNLRSGASALLVEEAALAEKPFPYLNRELSMLDFHNRVLHQARDRRAPPLEPRRTA
jgi:Polyphosphate kinase N-terminal domain